MESDDSKLPYLYWLPKFHKEVVGFRFITSGSSCSIKPLSINLGIGLKYCIKAVKQQSKYDNFYCTANDFYIIENSKTVIDFLHSSNYEHSKQTVSTYNFQTLYTHIPHIQLKANLKMFIERVFQIKAKKYICVTKKSAFFSDKYQNKFPCFTKEEFLASLDFLINNSYITFKGSIFRQIIGIPMGTNSAPHMANIYLFVYEYNYVLQLKSNQKQRELRALQSIFRFQDDLLVLNDNGLFESIYKDIYPPEMVLKKTNISSSVVNFLDCTISVYHGKFAFKLFDKRDEFNFNVINYPYACGNVPKAPTHGIFVSQLIRFCNMNSSLKNYFADSKKLYAKLVNQNFEKKRLQHKFDDFCVRHILYWAKFGVDIEMHKNEICAA